MTEYLTIAKEEYHQLDLQLVLLGKEGWQYVNSWYNSERDEWYAKLTRETPDTAA